MVAWRDFLWGLQVLLPDMKVPRNFLNDALVGWLFHPHAHYFARRPGIQITWREFLLHIANDPRLGMYIWAMNQHLESVVLPFSFHIPFIESLPALPLVSRLSTNQSPEDLRRNNETLERGSGPNEILITFNVEVVTFDENPAHPHQQTHMASVGFWRRVPHQYSHNDMPSDMAEPASPPEPPRMLLTPDSMTSRVLGMSSSQSPDRLEATPPSLPEPAGVPTTGTNASASRQESFFGSRLDTERVLDPASEANQTADASHPAQLGGDVTNQPGRPSTNDDIGWGR